MSVVNRIIVTCRLENGDAVDVTAKAVDRPFDVKDIQKVRSRIAKQFAPQAEDTLYYQVRVAGGVNGKEKRNWSRVPDLKALDTVIEEAMVTKNEAADS